MVNRLSLARKIKRNLEKSSRRPDIVSITSFEGSLRDILRIFSKRRPWEVDSGRLRNFRLGCLWHFRSGCPWNGQIEYLGENLGTLEETSSSLPRDAYFPSRLPHTTDIFLKRIFSPVGQNIFIGFDSDIEKLKYWLESNFFWPNK